MTTSHPTVASVAFPIAVPGVYDYRIPEQYAGKVVPGIPVLVELRKRSLWGVAVRISTTSVFPDLKPILEIKTDRWTDADRSLIRLYEWIAAYYQCDIGKIFRPFIKKGLATATAKTVTVYRIVQLDVVPVLTARQCAAYDALKTCTGKAYTAADLQKTFCVSAHMVQTLCNNGILVRQLQTVVREAVEMSVTTHSGSIVLTTEQQQAVQDVLEESQDTQRPCLLYGITGSGKTHVYIALVKEMLARGKSSIILVPEISLTPQTIGRFKEALGSVITVIHSRMSDGERRDSLEELVTGRKRVVIGVRSAILAPIKDLGLIVVDEEHDGSYKQSDMEPRYNARDVSVMRGKFQKAAVVLGSATPAFETYYNALNGKYRLIELSSRFGAAALPRVAIIDMGEEHKDNNWTLLSRYLKNRISETLEQQRQIILLLNRRGFSTVLLCKDCAYTCVCPQCSVNLTYHKSECLLKCHQCGYTEPAPLRCPKCGGEQIKYKGTGIQKAEEFLQELFPQSRIVRMDQDTTRRKGSHMQILESFAQHDADILLGTQMVAKGLNFPGVALVGVLQADIGMHFPDFRAAEKTFQLLAQVAGRAGRADSSGEVIIQTYYPQEAGIVAAGNHDFVGFYEQEILSRKELAYPPFGKLLRVVTYGMQESSVQTAIAAIARQSTPFCTCNAITALGPSPAVFSRVNNQFRYGMIFKGRSIAKLQELASSIRQYTAKPPAGIRVQIDVDPMVML